MQRTGFSCKRADTSTNMSKLDINSLFSVKNMIFVITGGGSGSPCPKSLKLGLSNNTLPN